MGRRRVGLLLSIVAISVGVVLFQVLAPESFESLSLDVQELLEGVPEPLVLGFVVLWVVVTWVAAIVLLAKALYWGWRQIDTYVFWLWNAILPESPLVRFAVGLTLMLFVFIFGPLLVLQGIDFLEEDDNVEETLDANRTDHPENETGSPGNETHSNDTEPTAPSNATVAPVIVT